MIIRQERSSDIAEIYKVVKQAFAFAEHKDGNEQELVNALRKSSSYIPVLSLVAQIDDKIAGHVMFTKGRVNGCDVLILAPLSVLPEFQRRGIGSALIQTGHEIAKKQGYICSIVLGSEFYYPKFGYEPASKYGIFAPFNVPDENLMVKFLAEPSSQICGTIEYPKEFFEV